MAKNLYNVTSATGASLQIGAVVRRHDANNWFGTFFVSGVYGGATIAWNWNHAVPSDTSGVFPMKDLSGNAVTSSSASGNDSFNSEFNTGKNNTDKIQLYVGVSGATSTTNLNVGYYDNQ
jgi:hypothetical protein